MIVKVVTGAKRFPILVGKLQGGTRIPFGPYTLLQVAVFVAAVLVFSGGSMIVQLSPGLVFVLTVIGALVGGVGVLLAGRVPFDGAPVRHRVLRALQLMLTRHPVSATGEPFELKPSDTVVLIGGEDGPVVIDELDLLAAQSGGRE